MNKKYLIKTLGGFLILLGLIVEAALYFSNPDMTQTRLFLTYWYIYILVFVLEIGGVLCFRGDDM